MTDGNKCWKIYIDGRKQNNIAVLENSNFLKN